MSDELLTNEEIESLLNSAQSESASTAHQEHAPDSKRTDVGDLLRLLQSLQGGVAERFGNVLSLRLRANASVRVRDVEQASYKEFAFRLDDPTCLHVLQADSVADQLLLDISPSILFPLIDRLLGGGNESGPIPHRPPTEIESRLMSRITSWFLDELRQNWQSVGATEFTVERVEYHPHRVQIVPPEEKVAVIPFEVSLFDAQGLISLCIPLRSLAACQDVSLRQPMGKKKEKTSIRNTKHHSTDGVGEIVATLAESTISMADLVGLRVGDIITTEKSADAPIQVSVDGSPRFDAALGSTNGRKAIRIRSSIAAETED